MLTFFETTVFTRQITILLDDAEYAELQGALVVNPRAGDLIQGTGGIRKIQWPQPGRGKGKRGGVPVIMMRSSRFSRTRKTSATI